MKVIQLFLLFFPLMLLSEEYAFQGKHLLASYYDCDQEAMEDREQLKIAMLNAVEKSGATILKHNEYYFEPTGFTMTILLSESHASIHTYPEHGACFIDLFTCGDKCSSDQFNKLLQQYLKPSHITCEIKERT